MNDRIAYDIQTILFERNIDHDLLEKALSLVEKFIIKKKLILTGGMAIDLALQLKGDSIYDDNEVPDYDFFSPVHKADAEELAAKLSHVLPKTTNIDIINAMHPTTLRVRVNYNVVADITYIPKHMFEKIKTMTVNSIVIEHPHYKYKSQHLAFCFPYMNAPREVIMHRWAKDAKRHDLLFRYYSIVDKPIFVSPTISLPKDLLESGTLSGYIAYKIHKGEIKDDGKTITLEHPDTPILIFKQIIKPTHYPELDYLPSTNRYKLNNATIYECQLPGYGLACNKKLNIATLQHCLMVLLHFEQYDLYAEVYEYVTNLNGDLQTDVTDQFNEPAKKRIRYPDIDYSTDVFQIGGELVKQS